MAWVRVQVFPPSNRYVASWSRPSRSVKKFPWPSDRIGSRRSWPSAEEITRSTCSTLPRDTVVAISSGSPSRTSISPGDVSCSQVAGGMSAVGSRSRARVVVKRSPSPACIPRSTAATVAASARPLVRGRHLTTLESEKPRSRVSVCSTSRSAIPCRAGSSFQPRVAAPPRWRSRTVSRRFWMPPRARSIRSATTSRIGRRTAGRMTNRPSAPSTAPHQPANTAPRSATGRGVRRSRSTPPTTHASARQNARRSPAASATLIRRSRAPVTSFVSRAARASSRFASALAIDLPPVALNLTPGFPAIPAFDSRCC